jgi:hypothetical protein
MIAHILIDDTSGYKNSFIIINFLNDFSKTLESFLKLINPVIHQPKMESAADKVFLQLECLFVHFNCLVDKVHVLLILLLVDLFCLSLVRQAF